MSRPHQAVILCGGLGTRLRPLTDTLPKPMVPVNGRPFLEYLVAQMRDQGIRRLLLLTGYRGEMIRAHFADGAAHGIEITYSHGPVDWDTGRRIWEARAQLDARFLLLYSDNFTQFSLDKLVAHADGHGAAVTLTLQPKATGNTRLGAGGFVEAYVPGGKAAGLDLVELGYMLVERDAILAAYDQPDISFSRVLERMAQRRLLAGLVSHDPYHSISDIARWKLAERYLAVKRILLIDRDGTINQRPSRGEYVTGWREFHWIDETVESMRQLASVGFAFIVLTNQAGIARGMVSSEAIDEVNREMVAELKRRNVEVLDVYVCPHHWDDACACRKPAPGMFFRAAREHLLRMDRTAYVGDDPRDCLAAYNAGCLSIMVGSDRAIDPVHGANAAHSSDTLAEAVPWIIERFGQWESRC